VSRDLGLEPAGLLLIDLAVTLELVIVRHVDHELGRVGHASLRAGLDCTRLTSAPEVQPRAPRDVQTLVRLLLLLVATCACAATPLSRPTPPQPWVDVCVENLDTGAPCIAVTRRDALAMRDAIRAALEADPRPTDPEWRAAVAATERPIIRGMIGGYYISYGRNNLTLTHVGSSDAGRQVKYDVTVHREAARWIVDRVDRRTEHLPKPMT
jgi:hypothetical protein